MSKKATYEILASQYYIEAQMSISTIAKRLNISEKTLHNWKKEAQWDKKRTAFLKSQYSTNQTLYELVHLVAKKALEDFKQEGIMPEQKTLYFIMNMADKLAKLKSYEDNRCNEALETTNNDDKEEANQNSEQAVLDKILKAFKGE